jgi:hypothetical protein
LGKNFNNTKISDALALAQEIWRKYIEFMDGSISFKARWDDFYLTLAQEQ